LPEGYIEIAQAVHEISWYQLTRSVQINSADGQP